jgi:mono/diheme cytochrome c family protein
MCYIPRMQRIALVLVSLLAACSGGAEGPAANHPEGEKLYRAMACMQCHGATGNGGSLAPPLASLADNWDRDALAEYLLDPLTVVERTPRLKALKNRYGTQMPAITALTDEQRLTLADYALALSAARVE